MVFIRKDLVVSFISAILKAAQWSCIVAVYCSHISVPTGSYVEGLTLAGGAVER